METTGILTKKYGMSRLMADDGTVTPVTMLVASPNVVEQIKTQDKDGYTAMVLGFEELKKPRKTRRYRFVREMTLPEGEIKKGDQIKVSDISEGSMVTLIGKSKGKGFQGVVRRWGASGGPATHGSGFHREPGSIGQCAKPGEVMKGKKMPGRMGGDRVTLKHRQVVKVIPDKNILLVKGAIPGARNSLVIVKIEK